ncbi:MAG: hypothetical protein JXR94_19430, partial [Candidatus Hydrogenedentes bacterium]|nr:hypothetical protein [Candidatus Hydrogenedentota bacterium]
MSSLLKRFGVVLLSVLVVSCAPDKPAPSPEPGEEPAPAEKPALAPAEEPAPAPAAPEAPAPVPAVPGAKALVKAGASDYRILLTAEASPSEKYAAEELQHYVEACTGVKLPIAVDGA